MTIMPIQKAERIAKANNRDDKEWSYVVKRIGVDRGYVEVFDEEKNKLGEL